MDKVNLRFDIKEKSDSLTIRSIGYEKKKVAIKKILKIGLLPVSKQIGEVIGIDTENAIPIVKASNYCITNKKIKQIKATSIDQIINQSAGVNMVDLGNEQHTMSIRRPIDYGASYLYLEDGIPIRPSGIFNHNALIEINMANTSRIEIIRGPASSSYGSEAIGGAINFISEKPTFKRNLEASLQANNIGYERIDFHSSDSISSKFAYRISSYFAQQKDGIIGHSDFNKLAISLGTIYYISDKTVLEWNSTGIDYNTETFGSIDSANFYNKSYESEHTFTNRKVNSFRSKLALNQYWNSKSKSSITSYIRNNSIGQNPTYRIRDDYRPWANQGDKNLAHGEINKNSLSSIGTIVQHKQNIDFLNSQIIIGTSADYTPNEYQAQYTRINKNNDGIYDSFQATDSSLAEYKVDLINLSLYGNLSFSPIKYLKINVGLRSDYFKYKFDNRLESNSFTNVLEGEDEFKKITPKLGITYDLKKNSGLYASYSQGFVPPQIGELYRGSAVPFLKAVFYENVESGAWITIDNMFFEFSVYDLKGQNEIISVLQDDGTTMRQNTGKTSHKGVEYMFMMEISKDFSFRLSGTNALHKYVDYEEKGVDFSGNYLAQAPRWSANGEISFNPVEKLRMSMEWQHIDSYYTNQENSKKYDGHSLYNLRVAYKLKKIELWANVINLGNQHYATIARANQWGQSFSVGQARNINIGISYKM